VRPADDAGEAVSLGCHVAGVDGVGAGGRAERRGTDGIGGKATEEEETGKGGHAGKRGRTGSVIGRGGRVRGVGWAERAGLDHVACDVRASAALGLGRRGFGVTGRCKRC